MVVLIMIVTHAPVHGERFYEPFWSVWGEESEHRFETFNDYIDDEKYYKRGDRGDGSHLLDVTELGLDPVECVKYADALKAVEDAAEEEYRFQLQRGELDHTIKEELALIKRMKPLIRDAVNSRYDPWTRRRHLVAFYAGLGWFA